MTFSFKAPLSLVIGANGSGKSSLMQTLVGLIEYQGTILINGQKISQKPKKELAQMLAFVPQLFQGLPNIRVMDYIMLGRFPHLSWLGQFSAKDRSLAHSKVDMLGIGHLVENKVSRVSGGELRKIALARALVQESPIILLDEPLQGLDPFQRNEFFDLLQLLMREGKMIVLVSHDRDFMEKFHPQIFALKSQQLWFQGKPQNLPSDWIHELYAP